MTADPRIRASDEDRDRVATLLREHHAAGRLTAEEFNERIDKAYQAKTLGELDELMADLPGIDLYRLPDASLQRYRRPAGGTKSRARLPREPGGPAAGHGRFSPAWRAAWGSWFTVSLVTFVIWAIATHGNGYPWFAWVAGPWGALMLGRWIIGGHPGGGRRRGHGEVPGGGRDQIGPGTPGQ